MSSSKSQRVYRVRGFPSNWKWEWVEGTFATLWNKHGEPYKRESSEILDIVPSLFDEEFAVVLLRLDGVPEFLKKTQYHSIQGIDVIFDDQFLGCTQLYQPQGPIVADIIAVTGLAANPYGSWTGKQSRRMWLREFLSQDFKNCRTITFGYDSRLDTPGFGKTEDYALDLLNNMSNFRNSDEEQKRPIIFIAQSYGGIIVSQVLRKTAMLQSTQESSSIGRLYRSIDCIIFFGTPHRGLTIYLDDLRQMLKADHPRQDLLKQLQNKDLLQNLREDLIENVKDRMIVTCCERRQTKRLKQNFLTGAWTRTGDFITAVDDQTSRLQLPSTMEYVIQRDTDHISLAKFDHKLDQVYVDIRKRLTLHLKTTHDRVAARFNSESRTVATNSHMRMSSQDDVDRQGCLNSLDFPESDFRRIEVGPAKKDTCTWVLQHEQFQKWTKKDHSLLWIKGKPGAGKSTLLKHLLTHEQLSPSSKELIIHFFFHGRGNELQKNSLGFFRSILYQLLEKAPACVHNIIYAYRKNESAAKQQHQSWQWRRAELQDLLREALPRVLKQYHIRIYVDALDEAGGEEAVDLLEYFEELLEQRVRSEYTFRICFSCRHYPILALNSGQEICMEENNHQDIARYVYHELARYVSGTKDDIADMIIKRSNGSFQWTKLVLRIVTTKFRHGINRLSIRREINQVPKDLMDLYSSLVLNLMRDSKIESSRLLRWVCLAFRPLTLTELCTAITVDSESAYTEPRCDHQEEFDRDDPQTLERRVTTLSGGLVEVQTHKGQKVVQIIHQTVNDFFLDHGLQLLDVASRSAQHALSRAHYFLARSCMRYFGNDEIIKASFKMVEFGENEVADKRIDEVISPAFPFLLYTVQHWIDHTKASEAGGICLLEILGLPLELHMKILARWTAAHQMTSTKVFGLATPNSTIFHVAARHNLIATVAQALCEPYLGTFRRIVDSKNIVGETALVIASEYGHEELARLLILAGKADINTGTNMNYTPLRFAVSNGHEGLLKLLLDSDVINTNPVDCTGETPLLYAAGRGLLEATRLLLRTRTVDVNQQDKMGRSPLIRAAISGNRELVKLLLKHKQVDVNVKDKKGKTACSYASEHKHNEIVTMLSGRVRKQDLNLKS